MTDKQLLNAVRRARRHLHAATGYTPEGGHYKAVDVALDLMESDLKERLKSPWAHVGPVEPGGKSILDMKPTHPTSGIPRFVAVDTVWGNAGNKTMIAPERMVVDTQDSDASPGEGFYATGDSGLRYWVGHLRESDEWPLGHVFKKGDFIGKTIPIPGNSDHGHWGVNGEAFLGKGNQFKYGTTGNGPSYTPYKLTYRQQLEGR